MATIKVFIGNKTSCKVDGFSTTYVKIFDGIIRTLGDVKFILNLKRSFISFNASNVKEYMYTCEGKGLRISKGNLAEMRG